MIPYQSSTNAFGEVIGIVDVLLKASGDYDFRYGHLKRLAGWLNSYHEAWIMRRTDESSSMSINVLFDYPCSELKELIGLVDSVSLLGCDINIILAADRLSKLDTELASLVEMSAHSSVSTIGIAFVDGRSCERDWDTILRAFGRARSSLELVGDYSAVCASGILNGPAWLNMTINLQGTLDNVDPLIGHRKDNCKSRFRTIIESDGTIYPCSGLIGIEQFSLGSIYNEFISNKIFRWDNSEDRIDVFYWQGPSIEFDDLTVPPVGVPSICALHRRLLGGGSPRSEALDDGHLPSSTA